MAARINCLTIVLSLIVCTALESVFIIQRKPYEYESWRYPSLD